MEIRNLYTFLQVASMQNFTQASRILGYSQSNVSMQIQQLEQEVGVPLFDRIGRGVVLTQYGQELIPYAQRIVSTAIQMESLLRSGNAMGGTIRVGFVESLFEMFFEATILRYRQRFPQVKIELTVDATRTLQELLRKNQLDLACLIDDPLPQTEWVCWHTWRIQIVVISNPANSLSKKNRVQLKELEAQEFVLMEESAPYSVRFLQDMAKQGTEIRSFLKMQNAGMARQLVEHGNYIAVLPYYTVKEAAARGRIRILQIAGFEHHQAVQLILHQNKAVTPQIRGFLEDMRAALDAFSTNPAPRDPRNMQEHFYDERGCSL